MPLKEVKVRHKSQPWLHDDGVKEAMEARDRARENKERTPCDETEREFRRCRNAVKTAQYRACSDFFLSSFRHSGVISADSSSFQTSTSPHLPVR